jgi:hypothetical protein
VSFVKRTCRYLAPVAKTRSDVISRARLFLLLACLLTSTLQVYVAQIHVHIPAYVAHAGIGATIVDVTGRAPGDDGPSNPLPTDRFHLCPLCHAAALGVALLAPEHSNTLPTSAAGSVPQLRTTSLVSIAAVSYSWQGRGPPLV